MNLIKFDESMKKLVLKLHLVEISMEKNMDNLDTQEAVKNEIKTIRKDADVIYGNMNDLIPVSCEEDDLDNYKVKIL